MAIGRRKNEARPKRKRHARRAQQCVGKGQVSGMEERTGPCELLAAAVQPSNLGAADGLLAAPCRQHGALGFDGIARTEAEELANRVASLEAQVGGCRRQKWRRHLSIHQAAPASFVQATRFLGTCCCLMLTAVASLPHDVRGTRAASFVELNLINPHPQPASKQLVESEQQYAEIYEEHEKAREFYAGVEAAMHKAQQQYVRDKREWQVSTGSTRWCGPAAVYGLLTVFVETRWIVTELWRGVSTWYCRHSQEASEEGAKALADAQAQLAAERSARDAADAQLATLQVRGGWPGERSVAQLQPQLKSGNVDARTLSCSAGLSTTLLVNTAPCVRFKLPCHSNAKG